MKFNWKILRQILSKKIFSPIYSSQPRIKMGMTLLKALKDNLWFPRSAGHQVVNLLYQLMATANQMLTEKLVVKIR